MNSALLDIKQSKFLIRYLEEEFKEKSISEIRNQLNIDEQLLLMIKQSIDTENYGENITISYIIDLYRLGFNYLEIGYLKDITKMGVRHHLKNNLKNEDLNKLKYLNKLNRKKIKEIIIKTEIYDKLTKENYEEFRVSLGYSESYFKLFMDDIDRKVRGDYF